MSALLNLVESLQTGLTHPDAFLQIDAIKKFNSGIKSLSIESFTLNEVSHVIDFYVSRLVISDSGIISCLLQGIFWFADQNLLDSHCAIKICRDGFFSNLLIRTLRKEERRIAFSILLTLLSNETTRKGLISLEQDFLQGFITSIEGENDPECLVSVFSMHPIVLNHFDVSFLAEEHFECIAAYFPVNYTSRPESDINIKRADLVEQLHLCLWNARIVEGGLLLPLLLEKVGSQRAEARADALALLADCLAGTLHAADAAQTENPVEGQERTLPMAHVTVNLFSICAMIKQLTKELNVVDDAENVRQLLCIVTGLARIYSNKAEEGDFVETFLRYVWPEKVVEGTRCLKSKLGGWFAVAQATSIPGAPEELVADCLFAAVLASPRLLLPRLIRRLVAVPLLWPRVNPLPQDECFYRTKFEQLVALTPHISFLNRVLSRLTQKGRLTPKLFQLKEEHIRAVVFNLSHTLKRSCSDLELCTGDDDGGKNQHRMAEIVSFSFLCRLVSMLREDYIGADGEGEVAKAFLAFCSHVFEHMVSDAKNGAYEQALRQDQQNLLASLISQSSLVEDGLLLLLFKMVQDVSSMGLFKVAVEVLQRAACTNTSILKNLFTLLFDCCSDAVGLSPATQLVSAVLYITGSLRKSADEEGILPMLASILLNHAVGVVQLTERLLRELEGEEAKSCLFNLLNALRLLTSSLSKEQQTQHFATFRNFAEKAELPDPYVAYLLDCVIFSAVRPSSVDTSNSQTTAIPLGPIVDLLLGYVAHVLGEFRPMSTFLWKLTINELCICAATLSNKFANDETVIEGSTKMLDLLLKSNKPEAASRFLMLMLRALIVTQTPVTLPQRQFLLDRLLSILLGATSDHVEVQFACLRDNLSLLIPLQSIEEDADETKENPEWDELLPQLDEEVTHCLVNPLAVQKCFCLVARPLRESWQQLRTRKDSSNEQSVLEENFLYGYLKLVSLLPGNIIRNYAAEALEAAIQAVVGEGCHPETPTRALGLRAIARLAAARHSVLASDAAAADDFLEKVARLRPTFVDTGTSSVGVSSLRFDLARCLRFLVDLPPAVTARHSKSVRRLLEDLLDDDCQSVRLEAARANNEWCLRV